MTFKFRILLKLASFCVLALGLQLKSSVLFHSVIRSKKGIATKNFNDENCAIVLLHGLLGSTRNFRSFARLLSNKLNDEYDIVIVDLHNHGRSSMIGPRIMDYTTMALDVYHTLDYLNIRQCHLIGHSMGGKVAAMTSLLQQKLKSSLQSQTKSFRLADIRSLCMMDICPVEYSAQDFASVFDTIDFLTISKPAIEMAKTRNEVIEIINTNITDNSLRAFLLTNIQESKPTTMNQQNTVTVNVKTNPLFSWRLHVSEINQSKYLLANFPQLDTNIYCFNNPTLIIKGGDSTNFVRSIYLEKIKKMFTSFAFTTQRNAGHWLHADQPDQTADKIIQFIKYAESQKSI